MANDRAESLIHFTFTREMDPEMTPQIADSRPLGILISVGDDKQPVNPDIFISAQLKFELLYGRRSNCFKSLVWIASSYVLDDAVFSQGRIAERTIILSQINDEKNM